MRNAFSQTDGSAEQDGTIKTKVTKAKSGFWLGDNLQRDPTSTTSEHSQQEGIFHKAHIEEIQQSATIETQVNTNNKQALESMNRL